MYAPKWVVRHPDIYYNNAPNCHATRWRAPKLRVPSHHPTKEAFNVLARVDVCNEGIIFEIYYIIKIDQKSE
jgi:hypothetical protein